MSPTGAPQEEPELDEAGPLDRPSRSTVGRYLEMLGRERGVWDNLLVSFLALFSALVVGAVVIVVTDTDTLDAWSNFLSDPGAALSESWDLVYAAYSGLVESSLGSERAIGETLVQATPLMFTGLSVALAFRTGLFNIGGDGQVLIAAALSVYVGFQLDLPAVLHLPVAVLAGIVGGAFWGAIAGGLKAWRGAHEVISTIMLNYIALRLVDYLLSTRAFQRPDRTDPITPLVNDGARYPNLFGLGRAHWGTVLALVCAVGVWWLLFRSTIGFRLRAVGANPSSSRYAGMSVAGTWLLAMGLAGGLAGLAGTTDTLGAQYRLTGGFTNYGFDGIAVALLGRSHPAGVIPAALLFGILRAGAVGMQAATAIPVDIIVVIQALVLLFVAAPALVREIYRVRVRARGDTEPTFAAGWGA